MAQPKAKCPICKAEMPANWTEYPDYPFCSKRCRTIDLGRWLGEEYRAAGPPSRDESSPGQGESSRGD